MICEDDDNIEGIIEITRCMAMKDETRNDIVGPSALLQVYARGATDLLRFATAVSTSIDSMDLHI